MRIEPYSPFEWNGRERLTVEIEHQMVSIPVANVMLAHRPTGRARVIVEGDLALVQQVCGKNFTKRIEMIRKKFETDG